MRTALIVLCLLLLAGCARPPFTVYPDKNRGNERPLVYDSSVIPTIFTSDNETLNMNVALHSREFPNGTMWMMSLSAEEPLLLPQKLYAFQDNIAYELIRLESDLASAGKAYYVLPPSFIKNCRFSDEMKLSIKIDDKEWIKISDKAYVENFGMFYSFVTLDTKRNTSIIFIH